MARKPPRKYIPLRDAPFSMIQGINPGCPPHGEPRKKGRPVYCLDCGQPVRGTQCSCFRPPTKRDLEELNAGMVDVAKGLEAFAQRMHGAKEKKKRAKKK